MSSLEINENANKTILERIAERDKTAVSELLNAYGNFVFSLAVKFTYTRADAEDAVQEIFVEIWKHAGRFDPTKSSEIGFIALIAKRRLIDGYRKLKVQPKIINSETVFDDLRSDGEKEMFKRLDMMTAIRKLNTLKPEQRDMIVLSFYEGFSHTEIAKTFGKPLGTVKTIIRRGLQNLRQNQRLEHI